MQADAEEVIAAVRDEIGLDAYHIYPTSRRMIPEAVLWAFASACILEFVKHFVDFKGLGEGARARIGALLAAWKEKRLDDVAPEPLTDDVAAATALLPAAVASPDWEAGMLRLQAALVELGLPSERARSHAEAIALEVLPTAPS